MGKPRLLDEDSLPRRMAGNSGLVGKILLVAGVLLYLGGLFWSFLMPMHPIPAEGLRRLATIKNVGRA